MLNMNIYFLLLFMSIIQQTGPLTLIYCVGYDEFKSLCEEKCSYFWWNGGSRIVGGQAWWYICDVGLLGTWRLVLLGWECFRPPGIHASPSLKKPWLVMILMSSVRHRRKARLWWSVRKVGTSWLGRHVLHLGWAADGLLAISVPTWDLVLGARLGGPHLNIEGGLARGRGCSVGGWDRLRWCKALGLSHRAGRRSGGC